MGTGNPGRRGRQGTCVEMNEVKRSGSQIHLPRLINEEAIADEFSSREQVS